MFAILDSMPDLSSHVKKSSAVRALMKEIDEMEEHIDAAEIMKGDTESSEYDAKNLSQIMKNAKFIKITKAGFYESMVHNVDQVIK